MNGRGKILMAAALFCVGTCAFARPHHHHNEGLELANGIVDLVCRVLKPAPVVVAPAPAPVVVTQPAVVTPAPAPVVVTPAPVVVAPPPHRPVYRPAPPPRRPAPPRGGHHGGRPRR